MRKGFTLVELSIVLVIIGLLIGGILVAQSMVSAAKVNSFTAHIQQYDIAMTNFRDRYKQFPGDSTLISPTGNGDGQIRDHLSNDDYFTGEIGNVWQHLSSTGILQEQYTSVTSPGVEPGVNAPKAKYGDDPRAGILVGMANEVGDPFRNDKNVYFITGLPTNGSSIYAGSGADTRYIFTPVEVLAVDKKADDGLAGTGNIRPAYHSEFQLSFQATCNSGNTYTVSNETKACSMIIRLQSYPDSY